MCWSPWLTGSIVNNPLHFCSIHKGLSYPLLVYSYTPFLEPGAKGEVSLSGIKLWQS